MLNLSIVEQYTVPQFLLPASIEPFYLFSILVSIHQPSYAAELVCENVQLVLPLGRFKIFGKVASCRWVEMWI